MSGRGRGLTLPAWYTSGVPESEENQISSVNTGIDKESNESPPAAPVFQPVGSNQPPVIPPPAVASMAHPSFPIPIAQPSPSFPPVVQPPSFQPPPFQQIKHQPPPMMNMQPSPMSMHQQFGPGGNGFFPPAPAFQGGYMPASFGAPGPMGGGAPPHMQFPPGGMPPPQFSAQFPRGGPALGFGPDGRIPPPLAAAGSLGVHQFPKSAGPPASTTINDPNNDVSCWAEHTSEEGRKYWHNRVTMTSTYDKPFCLKTPEERSIPACPWKEFISDGKKYYNNGTEST